MIASMIINIVVISAMWVLVRSFNEAMKERDRMDELRDRKIGQLCLRLSDVEDKLKLNKISSLTEADKLYRS